MERRDFLKSSVTGAAALGSSSPSFAELADSATIPKRKFGRHDDRVSVVGFGGHTLYLSGSQKEANEIFAHGLDLGVNFWENAWDYHEGEAENYMGIAMEGKRDQVFLMSKFCIYHSKKYTRDKKGAMLMLEDSLRRLKTDHLDLWMLHNVKGDDAKDAYVTDGAIEALELAKKQGKIRYTGFTGHTKPQIHVDLIESGYQWDATLMPVSVVGALDSRNFEKQVMPLCEKYNIAVLGMKGFGGSRRTELHGKTNVTEALRYSLSYRQVCTHVVGVDKMDYVDQAVAAAPAKPMSASERAKYAFVDNSKPDQKVALQHGGRLYEKGLGEEESSIA